MTYLALVLAATLFSLLITPFVTSAALALGLVDAPDGRKVHSMSVPRVGGLAVILAAGLALAGTVAALRWQGADSPTLRPLAPILVGAALVFGVGLLDDLRALPVAAKLIVQVVAAGGVMASGLLIERLSLGGHTWPLGALSWLVTLLWIVGLTNAFNLIDGIDGLAAGIVVIAGAACATILVIRGHSAEAMLLAALVGGALGFLAFNFAPASIFLGDGGSLVFGFLLATTAITGWQKGATALAAGVPLLIFALPLADALTTLARRARRAPASGLVMWDILRRIIEPDREHIHHRLTRRGWSTRRTVLLLYAVTAVLSCLALVTARFE